MVHQAHIPHQSLTKSLCPHNARHALQTHHATHRSMQCECATSQARTSSQHPPTAPCHRRQPRKRRPARLPSHWCVTPATHTATSIYNHHTGTAHAYEGPKKVTEFNARYANAIPRPRLHTALLVGSSSRTALRLCPFQTLTVRVAFVRITLGR